MAGIKIEKTINLTTTPNNIDPRYVATPYIANEADNDLVQYYVGTSNDLQEDKSFQVVLSNYTTGKWGGKNRRLTTREVRKIGVKAFPGVGAIGFFKYLYENRSMVMCPVNNNTTQFTAPDLAMSVGTDTVTFTITGPEDIEYECYRVVLRNKLFAIEYVTYKDIFTIPLPDVKGTYSVYCFGYVSEGEHVSFDSNSLELVVTEGKDSFEPDPAISYYTKEQIDDMLDKALNALRSAEE